MPLPQNIFANTIQGFVCRTCSLKLREPVRQQKRWIQRAPINSSQLSKSQRIDRLVQSDDASSVRYYEETADGRRKEVLEGQENEQMEADLDLEELGRQAGIDPADLMEALESNANFSAPEGFLDDMIDDAPIDQALQALQMQNRLLEDELQQLISRPRSSAHDNSSEPFTSLKTLPALENISWGQAKAQRQSAPLQGKLKPVAIVDKARTIQLEKQKSIRKESSVYLPVSNFPSQYQKSIQSLLDGLNAGPAGSLRRKGAHKARARTINTAATVWKSYLSSRPGLRLCSGEVPRQFWTKLWQTFATSGREDFNRMSHVKLMGDDMRSADISLTATEELLYIEAVFVAGEQARALREWEAARRSITWGNLDEFKQYQELGIRMYCVQNDLPRVLALAQDVLDESSDQMDYRILIPIIKLCLQMNASSSIQQAWHLYEQLRYGLGPKIEMSDYDAVTSMLLAADRADLALQVFIDMMSSSTPSTQNINTSGVTKDKCILALADAHSSNAQPTNRKLSIIVGSKVDVAIPSKFRNKFFFGSWTKKLIGDGELEGVKKVFDLMADRGLVPLPIHMNGLIGAWIREGSEENRQKAEDLAWRMIKARIDYAHERRLMSGLEKPLRTFEVGGYGSYKNLFNVPFATMETFTILLQQYRRRQKTDQFPVLFDAVDQAKIPVDTVFVNELLWLDTREHHKGWVWKSYQSLMDRKATRPDFITYAILWQNMKKQEDPVIGRKPGSSADNFTTCRLLFKDMIERTTYLREQKKEMRRELYDLIVISFCYSRDVEATAVALRALQKYYGVYPDVDTARAVIVQLARLGLIVQYGEDRRILSNPGGRQRIEEVTQIFELLKERRKEALQQEGLVFDELSAELKQEESLTMLIDLLRYAFDSRRGDNILTETSSRVAATRAAQEMGVPDCNPWTNVKIGVEDLTVV